MYTLGEFEAALQAFQENTALRAKSAGPEHADTQLANAYLARSLWSLGRASEAMALLDHAMPILGPALGVDSPSYLRMVKLRELMTRSPVPDLRTTKVVDLFLG